MARLAFELGARPTSLIKFPLTIFNSNGLKTKEGKRTFASKDDIKPSWLKDTRVETRATSKTKEGAKCFSLIVIGAVCSLEANIGAIDPQMPTLEHIALWKITVKCIAPQNLTCIMIVHVAEPRSQLHEACNTSLLKAQMRNLH
jgi:hypothetical protein